jgi:predicted  nucleic acid-binding Zn-ribbon protein
VSIENESELRKFDYVRDDRYGYIMQCNMTDGEYTLSEDVAVLQERLRAAEERAADAENDLVLLNQKYQELRQQIEATATMLGCGA